MFHPNKNYKKSCISLLVENQKSFNSCFTQDFPPGFGDKLLDLVEKVYSNLLAWELISVQPLAGPTGLVYRSDKESLEVSGSPLYAIARNFKRKTEYDFGPKDAASAFVEEIDSEILRDLWDNCGTAGCVKHIGYFKDHLDDFLKIGLGSKPNWAVVNPKYCYLLEDYFNEKKISIYPHGAVKGVLVGFKGESFMDSGYVYSPYVPFSFYGNGRVMTRYAKKLYENGSLYYGRLTVLDELPDQE